MKHVIIAHGVDGLDEVSILGPTKIAEVKDGRIDKYEVTPEDFGFSRAKFEDVMGGDPQFNARVIRDIFEGRDGTDQNAAIHLYTHERACPEARSARGRGVSNNARARQRPWISAVSARADSRAA